MSDRVRQWFDGRLYREGSDGRLCCALGFTRFRLWQLSGRRTRGGRRRAVRRGFRLGRSSRLRLPGFDGFAKTGFAKTGFAKTGFAKTGFAKTGFGKTGFGKTRFGKTRFGKTRFGKTRFGKTRFGMSRGRVHRRVVRLLRCSGRFPG